MKNDIATGVDKPDDRKAYSEPCMKRLGKLDEIAKQGQRGLIELVNGTPFRS
jgi:hypothetical protein